MSARHRVSIALVCLVLSSAAPGAARAQPAAAPAARGQYAALPAAARKLAEQGSAALAANDLPTAQARLEQAFRQQPVPVLLRALGELAKAQGRPVSAADLFRRYLHEAGDELAPGDREELQRQIREISLPTDEVAVAGEDGGLVVIDDRVTGVLPLSLPLLLSAGTHRVRVERDRRRVETRLEVLQNRPVEVRFTMVPPVALVSPTGAAVLLPTWGDVPEAARSRLWRAASKGAAGERVLLIPEERVAAVVQATPALGSCLTEVACQEQLAAALEAQYVLRLRAEGSGEGPAGLRFALEVHDVAAGPGANSEQACAPCTPPQAGRALGGLLARALREVATRPRGAIEVATRPKGAALRIDGRSIGVTPQRRAAFAGEHALDLTLAGYKPYNGPVTVAGEGVARVDLQLEKLPPPPAPPKVAAPPPLATAPQPVYGKWWFWGAVGLAVAAGAVAGGVGGYYATHGEQGAAPETFPNERELRF